MKKYNRIFVIVLDSLGIGAMPDSERFGDIDVDTFGHILERMQTLDIPNLTRLGMLNLHCGGQMQPEMCIRDSIIWWYICFDRNCFFYHTS